MFYQTTNGSLKKSKEMKKYLKKMKTKTQWSKISEMQQKQF